MNTGKKSIAIVIRALSIGGAEKQSLLAAKYLQREYNVFYFIQKNRPCEYQLLNFLSNSNINYYILNGNLIKRILDLNNKLKQNNINIIFSYLSLDNLLISACKLINKNLITVGGVRNSTLPIHKFLIIKFLHYSFLNFVIFNNESGRKKFLNKGFKESKCFTIPNCIELKEFPNKTQKSEEIINIITVGRFVPQKDWMTALNAFKYLKDNNPNYKFKYYIIGYGILEQEIRSYIFDHDIKNVEIVKKPKNINEYYGEADVYLCASLFEGISNTLLEALSHSLPIIATNVGDNNYLVEDGRNGFLVEVKDFKAMANKIIQIIKDNALKRSFGNEGRKILIEKFSPEIFVDNYVTFIQDNLK